MTKEALRREIRQVCYLKGDFLLRSGQRSTEYFDKYKFEAIPRLLKATAEHLKPLIPEETELLAGLEMGGVPLAAALSMETGIPLRFVRKKAKPYGTQRICEGGEVSQKKICIIEDVITTGGQALISLKELEKAGADVLAVLCVIHRGEGQSFKEQAVRLISLFHKKDLLQP